jgi:MYXO-CTERM domain-containing protein
MPEVKTFSFSTITGYSGPDAALKGIKNSIWLSLVPASWQQGLATVPGTPTSTPGTNADGTGPAPRTTAPGTNPAGDQSTDPGSVIPDGPDPSPAAGSRAALGSDNGGCSVGVAHGSSSGLGGLALAMAAALVALRRSKKEEN